MNSYTGTERAMILPNCQFRMGGAAILLSNRWADRRHVKYYLVHVVRTHNRADDKSYRCVSQEADSEGKVGIKLNIDLMAIAEKARKWHLSIYVPTLAEGR
ncbi:hypothetical protein ACS0TY_003549 [Phlomoides rotata]